VRKPDERATGKPSTAEVALFKPGKRFAIAMGWVTRGDKVRCRLAIVKSLRI
jgi:hypothetical protein